MADLPPATLLLTTSAQTVYNNFINFLQSNGGSTPCDPAPTTNHLQQFLLIFYKVMADLPPATLLPTTSAHKLFTTIFINFLQSNGGSAPCDPAPTTNHLPHFLLIFYKVMADLPPATHLQTTSAHKLFTTILLIFFTKQWRICPLRPYCQLQPIYKSFY
jgi:hypothetical protein